MQSHRNSGPGQLLRSILQEVDDSGPQQLVKVTGLFGQTIGEAVRSQHFGFSSNPPKDAEGLMLAIGGGIDRVHALGLEHPKYRPRNLPSGGSIQYDKEGDYVKVIGDTLTISHAKKIVIQVGSNKLTIDSDGFHYSGPKIDHDGHRIDKQHKHVEAGGVGLSGVPE